MSKPDFEDDGRTVAPMDGVPANPMEAAGWFGRFRTPQKAEACPEQADRPDRMTETLTPRETRSFIGGALLAALAVGAVFAVCGALFILFCTQVWLR